MRKQVQFCGLQINEILAWKTSRIALKLSAKLKLYGGANGASGGLDSGTVNSAITAATASG